LTDTLSDGSVVTLNKKTSLSYPNKFKGDKRSVALQGEAFFKVTPDSKKPFIIQSNDVTIKVIGTSFNVRNDNNATEVIVETGIVEVSHRNSSIELRPGEKLVVHAQDTLLTKEKQQDKLYNYYSTKQFVCDNTPLWKLVQALNDAYDAHIEIGRPELRNIPITTTFNNESLDRILEIVRLTLNISVTKTGDKIILR
ncbi:MAG: FecR domain-containing protein, partial [Chitinophagaceae bacterium]